MSNNNVDRKSKDYKMKTVDIHFKTGQNMTLDNVYFYSGKPIEGLWVCKYHENGKHITYYFPVSNVNYIKVTI